MAKRKLRKWVKVTLAGIGVASVVGIASQIEMPSMSAMESGNPVAASAEPTENAETVETAKTGKTETVKSNDQATTPETQESVANVTETAEPEDEKIGENVDDELQLPVSDLEDLTLGNAGRLYFENGWSVALNRSEATDVSTRQAESQAYADAADSASMVEYNGKVMIADHANQGFDVMNDYLAGSTAKIVTEDGTHTIKCVSFYSNAYVKDGYLFLPDGTEVWKVNDGSIIMETNTTDDGTKASVSYWNIEDAE